MYGRIGRRKNYGEIVKKKCTHTPHAYEYAAMNTRATSLHTYSLRERERIILKQIQNDANEFGDE